MTSVMLPEVGSKYKVQAVNASGYYEVKEIKEVSKGKFEVVARSDNESYARTFRPEQFLLDKQKGAKVSKAKRIVSSELETVAEFGQVKMVLEDVQHWPSWGARGRPRKGA